MSIQIRPLVAIWLLASGAQAVAQGPPNVSQVLTWSTLTDKPIQTPGGLIPRPLFSIYTTATPVVAGSDAFGPVITNPRNYRIAHSSALSGALNANIAAALSVVPLSSPTSGVMLKKDPVTGALLPASSSLGPIFTQRAETVGKGNIYIGLTQQNYHFSAINGKSLNGLSVLYGGGDPSGIRQGTAATSTAPATFNVGMDVRLSQNLAFITYGVTNRFDVSVGLSMVHSAVAARAYNGVVYSGSGANFDNKSRCWCVNTITPGQETLTLPQIGSASSSKSGFGDMVLRFKGGVFEKSWASLAVGTDLRLPTGDAQNYLGLGTTSVKPFAALSLYSKPMAKGIIFAPHFDVSWQVSGKSTLGGTLQGTSSNFALSSGGSIPVLTAPFTATKGTLPDIFSWAAGTEIALNKRNTIVLDVFGNQIGMIHNIQLLGSRNIADPAPALGAGSVAMTSGMTDAGRGSFGQYSGSFGYKMKIAGNLVASFQAMVRLNSSGLTDRFVPLYGLGYSF